MTQSTPHNPQMRRARLAGVVGTLLFHGMILLVLLLTWLYPSMPQWPPRTVAPVDSAQILFGSEYVKIGDVDILADDASQNLPATSATESAETPARPGHELAPSGPEGDAAPTVSSTRPSPAKATTRPAPEKAGTQTPTPSTKAADRAAQEAEAKRNARTNFSRQSDAETPAGRTGSPDGNAAEGAASGTPGYYLAGRTLAKWSKPSGRGMGVGTIIINVKVNRDGAVIAATYGGGSGPVAANGTARANCIAAAMSSQFSVNPEADRSQTGTITYHFR